MIKKITILFVAVAHFSCSESKPEEEVVNQPSPTELLTDTLSDELDSTAKSCLNLLANYSEFNGYTINTYAESYQIKGDFFGDKIEDIAVLIKNDSETKIGIINYGADTLISILGIGEDSLRSTDYGWVGIFEKVEIGDTLWSNYEEDWRSLEDVPKNELVQLNYNAIYAHASESCGGGFIFWKDNKWNWLQQE